jgi:hypothetical protein
VCVVAEGVCVLLQLSKSLFPDEGQGQSVMN